MNEDNYATQPQSVRLKRFNYLQDTTDCVWINRRWRGGIDYSWILVARCECDDDMQFYGNSKISEWCAAPNAQELFNNIKAQILVDIWIEKKNK